MRPHWQRWAWLVAPSLALAIIPACGGGTPAASSSGDEVTVSGTVKAEGQPVAKGQIHFDPANVNRKDASARTVAIGPDGTYTITTLVGQNRIRVTDVAAKRNQSFDEIGRDVRPGEGPLDINLIPTVPRSRR